MSASISRRLFSTAALATLVTAPAFTETLEERKAKLLERDRNVSEEALGRKRRSEALLAAEGVPINPYLPAIETEAEAKRRSKDEVAYRAMILMAVAMRSVGMPEEMFAKVIAHYGLADHATPKEKAFITAEQPTDRDRVDFSWRYEAAYPLMWALGYVDTLDKPSVPIDPDVITEVMRNKRTSAKFIADAKLRPLSDILDKVDLIYRYRWAIVDARLARKEPPAGLNPSVAVERHHALNWLIGYMDQEWDDISTDT